MTPQEINIAVAECLGWYGIVDQGYLQGLRPVNIGIKSLVPNFTQSLDACSGFEEEFELISNERYTTELGRLIKLEKGFDTLAIIDYLRATPLQRCEAYLRVKGKWKEPTK